MSPAISHSGIIKREISKLKEDGWLVFTEVHYRTFIFDIFAVNPETKQMKVIEVDVGHDSSSDKLKYVESLGLEIKVVRPTSQPVPYRSVQETLNALGDPIRLRIIELLAQNDMRYVDILNAVNLTPKKDAGRFGYHMKTLASSRIITKKETSYTLSDTGKKIFNFIKNLE